MSNSIAAYWWSPRRSLKSIVAGLRTANLWYRNVLPPHAAFTNYGDELNSVILPELTGRPVRWAPLGREELVGIGTLLDLYLEQGGRGLVLGSGAANLEQPTERIAAVADRFLAVRGPMTRDAMGLGPALQLGDPGLAVRSFGTKPKSERRGRVFVPHYRDYATDYGRNVIRAYRDAGFTIAHPTLQSRRMIDILGGAEFVASSGMHGMILSHALRTPVALVSVAENVPALPGRKYQDYVASVGLDNRLVSWRLPLGDGALQLVEDGESDVAAADARIDELVTGLHRVAAPLRSGH